MNIESIITYGHRVRFPANSLIFVQRDTATKLYYLEKGLVKLSFFSQQGDERIVAFMSPGLIFGEAAILLEKHYGITATAMVESTIVIFNQPEASKLIREIPDFAELVSTSMAKELLLMGHQIIGNSFFDVTGRVVHALVNLSYQLELGNDATLNLTHAEIAKFVGTTRVSVTNVLTYLEGKGLILKDRNYIKIIDRKELKNWLNQQSYI